MKEAKPKISLQKANNVAKRFLALIAPYITKAEIAGGIRRENKEVSEIVIVCVDNTHNPLDNLFSGGYKGLVTNGKRLKKFSYPESNINIELYIVASFDYGRMLAIRTGSSAYHHIKISIVYNRLGWCATENGLRRKKECDKKGAKWILKKEYEGKETKPPFFSSESEFFNFLGQNWIPPNQRNWIALKEVNNY